MSGVAGIARAAEVRLAATENCVEISAIIDEVEGVIGRPLATVMGARFDVEITRVGPRRWRLQLRTMDTAAAGHAEARATRELEGATCEEVASAAAVAIAVSIQTAASEERPTTIEETSPKRSSPPAPSQPKPVPAPPVVGAGQAARSAPSRPRAFAALVAVGDAGSLPNIGVGAELDLGIALGRWRARGLLAAFAPQETGVDGGTSAGGKFNLFFGGIMACSAPQLSFATLTACLGGELGRISGEGTGATHPRLGSVLWAAGRAELGLAVPIRPGWDLAFRGSVIAPLSRPRFEVNGTTQIHQPAMFAGRFAAGVEVTF